MNPSFETESHHQHSQKTLPEFFYHWEETQANKTYLRQPIGDTFIDFSWGEVGRQARILATYLHSLGLEAGSPIGLVSKNCAHWIIADLAILISGHISVPFYPTLTGDQLRQVLEYSGCSVLFVGKLDNWSAMKPGVPTHVHCISFPDYQTGRSTVGPIHAHWNDILANYAPTPGHFIPKLDDLFTIVYTSGTTGNPKGVMQTYRAAALVMEQIKPFAKFDIPAIRFFSYLPLCHLAERVVIEAGSLLSGGTIYFAESLDTFAKNLVSASPTHFLAVPRIWAKFQASILTKLPPQKLDFLLRLPLISSIISKKIRRGLGLDQAVVIITAAAPMPASLIKWFRRIGILIQEAYGLTETMAIISLMPSTGIKDGTLGKVYPGMMVRIDPITGEIQARADWLMQGYYREPAMTAQVLNDGWLHTGDVGELDNEGYLKLTGRVKELFKTAKGEYVSPSQIEVGFAENTFVEQVCVSGVNLPQPVALVVLSETGQKADRSAVTLRLEDTIRRLNPQLHTYEQIKKVVVVKMPWTIDNNMMTPTLKIKRNVVEAYYEPQLESWYAHPDIIVWEA